MRVPALSLILAIVAIGEGIMVLQSSLQTTKALKIAKDWETIALSDPWKKIAKDWETAANKWKDNSNRFEAIANHSTQQWNAWVARSDSYKSDLEVCISMLPKEKRP